jgi:hypothetical protein
MKGKALASDGRESLAWSNGNVGGDGRWLRFLGQNNHNNSGISYARGIAKWRGGTAASRWWLTLAWGKVAKSGGSFGRSGAFIPRRRERERCMVPHVDDWTPALSHLTVLVSPIPRPLTGGPRSVFWKWRMSEAITGCTVHGPALWTRFLIFPNWTNFVNYENLTSVAPKIYQAL